MTFPILTTAATASFEAARKIDLLPAGHRRRPLHGHSFQVTVFADLPVGWNSYPGGETDALRARLATHTARLDYSNLNDLIQTPTDENLAKWIHQQLDVPGVRRIALRSAANQGVDLDRDGLTHVWRRFRFQAAHQLPNVAPGHKCGRMHGHGFEAVVQARQAGGAESSRVDSGPVSDDLGDALVDLWTPLHEQLDYQCLNEIEGLKNPTSEMLSAWIWAALEPSLPGLSGITVFETGSCGAHFDGSHFRIWREFTLDSAVRLHRAPQESARRRLHGHTYTLRLHIKAPLDVVTGWTIDFGDVKTMFDPIFKALDHQYLNDITDLADGDAASIARWVMHQARRQMPSIERVDLYETPGCGAVLSNDADVSLMPV